ncbi:NAD(P)H-binding protein [Amycolatopsis sp. NPDC059021]|uniref:NAD(P)H-binding protein n=1 Tax=Amycolatopsis sp. NPDC059021 TaxID=3346704 RepID=UPI003670CFC4
MTILVTGARGHVGGQVLAQLLDAGEKVRAASRDASTLDVPEGVETVSLDLEDPDAGALDGVRAVFLYTRPQGIEKFVAAAQRAGVDHVVQLSSSATLEPFSENRIAVLHRAVEEALAGSGLGHTVLHPGYFASNTLAWAAELAEGVVRTPYPDARVGAIHEADIAAVAVRALTTGEHRGASLALSGPEALSFRELATILGDVLDRPVKVVELSTDEARERMLGHGLPDGAVDAILRSWANALDEPSPVTKTVEEVTGTAPRTFATWVWDHRADF